MGTQTFWITVGLIATALLVTTPLAHLGLTGRRAPLTLHVAGVAAVLSFTLEPGWFPAVLTIPWLVHGLALVAGELRTVDIAVLIRRPQAVVLAPLATWCWLAAGGAWLTAHRSGIEPLGFDRVITLLTVGHFHVAGVGFAALLLLTHRRRPGRVMLGTIWLHHVGMLVVAAGLTFDDRLEVLGAAMLTVALTIWSVTVVRWLRAEHLGHAGRLIAIAVTAWILPMVLALGWALGPFLPEPVVTTFATMVRYHATLQTFGLVLCGLLGLTLVQQRHDARPPTDHDHDNLEARHAVAHPTNT